MKPRKLKLCRFNYNKDDYQPSKMFSKSKLDDKIEAK